MENNCKKNTPYEFSEERAFFYRVLKKLFTMKKNGITYVSSADIQQSLYTSYYPITVEQVEEIFEELYNGSILGRWEYENGTVKYELML